MPSLLRSGLVAALALGLSACGQAAPARLLPTAYIVAAPLPTPTLPPTSTPTPPSTPLPTPTPPPTLPDTAEAQYRAWMQEARQLHPYPESLEVMWAVMICESSGDPSLQSDAYAGLFQYEPGTWAGDWNPYRSQPILDPHAQIFATAKAWHDGNQHWWGCYSSA